MEATLQGLLVGFIVDEKDYLPAGDLQLHDSVKEARRQEYLQKGDGLTVSHIGDGVTFVKVGDRFALTGTARATRYVNPQGGIFDIIREADIAFKITE